MSQTANCISCRKPQGQHHCGLCTEPVCRSCALFLEQGTFAFLPTVAEDLQHSYYCAPCHELTVVPAIQSYEAMLAQAKDVFFFFDSRKRAIPVMKKSRDIVEVLECTDRDEVILRLGFMAATQGFNAIVDANVRSEKVRDHAYQKMNWRGRGWPAKVDAAKLDRNLDD